MDDTAGLGEWIEPMLVLTRYTGVFEQSADPDSGGEESVREM